MANLETTYLGINLKNPIIVSSSGLTSTLDKIKELEQFGAGAVILKSIFEEQINHEVGNLETPSNYPEAGDYLSAYVKSNAIDTYIQLIKDAKQNVSIPVIASINCISSEQWVEYAIKIAEAGADALEVNVFYVPNSVEESSAVYEKLYFDIAEKIKSVINIPVAFKLGNNFTNPLYIANQLGIRKVDGLTLFNRFYSPDIDIEHMKITAADVFSAPSEIRQTLRWVGMLSNRIRDIDISASTGVHDGRAAIKLLLAGAQTVQICSVLYKKGNDQIPIILEDIEKWMQSHNYKTLKDFRGKLNYERIPDPALYERVQFMKYFSSLQ
jgi:dihydroorotate dehydrogenase (fumarate)